MFFFFFFFLLKKVYEFPFFFLFIFPYSLDIIFFQVILHEGLFYYIPGHEGRFVSWYMVFRFNFSYFLYLKKCWGYKKLYGECRVLWELEGFPYSGVLGVVLWVLLWISSKRVEILMGLLFCLLFV